MDILYFMLYRTEGGRGFRDTLLNKTYLNGYFLLILYIECNSVYGGTAKAHDKAV